MSTVLTREEVNELLPAYALGSLDADERTAMEQSLARYPDLRVELADYGAVVFGLATAVPQRPPPARVKVAVLAAAQPRARTPAPEVQPTWWQRLIDSLSAGHLATRLAVAALVLGVGLTAAQLARNLPAGMQALAEQQRASAIFSSAKESVHLDGTQQAPDGWALIRYARGQRIAAMFVGDLPTLPASQTYQLWMVDNNGKRWSGALFNVGASNKSLVLVNCPQTIDSIVRFGVSIEPVAGSPAPTGPGVLRS